MSQEQPSKLKTLFAMIFGLSISLTYIFLGLIMPTYALIKDYQHGKIFWAVIDLVIFPIGSIRGLIYFFGG